jgi:hypothetical protein
MKLQILCTLALCTASAGAAEPARPLVPLLDAAAITKRCDSELAGVRAALKAMESRPEAG